MSDYLQYAAEGVKIVPANPSPQESVEIVYDGLLPRSGATEVYAHVGFDEDWRTTQDYRMSKTADGFETTLYVPEYAAKLNVCFKDAANNWDNNSGANYTFAIEAGRMVNWGGANIENFYLTEAAQELTPPEDL